jgi:hypothetical protein
LRWGLTGEGGLKKEGALSVKLYHDTFVYKNK